MKEIGGQGSHKKGRTGSDGEQEKERGVLLQKVLQWALKREDPKRRINGRGKKEGLRIAPEKCGTG